VVINIYELEKDYKRVLISMMVGEDTDHGRKVVLPNNFNGRFLPVIFISESHNGDEKPK